MWTRRDGGDVVGRPARRSRASCSRRSTTAHPSNRSRSSAKPDILACLATHGVVVDSNAPNEEIYTAVNQDLIDNGQLLGFEPCYRGVLSTAP